MMYITISGAEFLTLSPATRTEILEVAKAGDSNGSPTSAPAANTGDYDSVDMRDVVDLTPKQMREWMEKASDKTKSGLRLFAEKPVVRARELTAGGIDNLAHFQSRTTIRTRTITGDKDAFLLGWDDWSNVEAGEGRYAVTPFTHESLRRYFHLS